jgi:hypothetical protein
MSTTETALIAHLVIPGEQKDDKLPGKICNQSFDKFGIEHSTLRV